MTPPEQDFELPANLVWLRRLVTLLLGVMIVGFVVLIVMFALRLSAPAATAPPLPDSITLPEGTSARAFTQGEGWYAIVTDDSRILIYDRASGALRQSIIIK